VPIVDSDESFTYHSPASGARGLIRVSRATGRAEFMRARGSRLAHPVPPREPRAATGGSWAETLRVYAATHEVEDDRFAPIPPSIWGDPKPMNPWSPPPMRPLSEGDYAPMPDEPNWQALRSKPTATTKPAASGADFDGYAPLPASRWD
jgi:hypothetical protein